MKQRFLPQRSVSLLHGIIRMAMIRRKRVIEVWTPLTLVFRSSLMSLIITFMFEPAKLQMNCASASGRINLRHRRMGRSAPEALAVAMLSATWSSSGDEGVVLDEQRGATLRRRLARRIPPIGRRAAPSVGFEGAAHG